jgi:hypothetical protein
MGYVVGMTGDGINDRYNLETSTEINKEIGFFCLVNNNSNPVKN